MNKLYANLLIYMVGELLAILIFLTVVKLFKRRFNIGSVIRGMLERLFLYIILINDLPQGLSFFGALKIATRLKDDDKISNDYFLTGNIISVLLVIGYYLMSIQNYWVN